MGAQENGLTLEGLAQRLQTLERENETLRTKVAILSEPGTRSTDVATLRGSDKHWEGESASESSELEGRVSRKWLLSKAGAAAVGTVAVGALMLRDPREATATHSTQTINADLVNTHTLHADRANVGSLSAIANDRLTAVYGETTSSSDPAVVGRNLGSAAGVWGDNQNNTGPGVHGKGKNGVFGESSTAGENGVWGRHTNQGAGVSGEGRVGVIGFSHENGWNAVWGRHTANGRGVAGDSAQGVGVSGESTSGYGGQFKGGKAQLKLVPKGTAGKPTTGAHTKGEIYMDSAGTLFVCTANGTPGTWKQVSTTAV